MGLIRVIRSNRNKISKHHEFYRFLMVFISFSKKNTIIIRKLHICLNSNKHLYKSRLKHQMCNKK